MVATMAGMGARLVIVLIAAVFAATMATAIVARISGGCPERPPARQLQEEWFSAWSFPLFRRLARRLNSSVVRKRFRGEGLNRG